VSRPPLLAQRVRQLVGRRRVASIGIKEASEPYRPPSALPGYETDGSGGHALRIRLQGGSSPLTPVHSRRQDFGDGPLRLRPAPPFAAISCHASCHARCSRPSRHARNTISMRRAARRLRRGRSSLWRLATREVSIRVSAGPSATRGDFHELGNLGHLQSDRLDLPDLDACLVAASTSTAAHPASGRGRSPRSSPTRAVK